MDQFADEYSILKDVLDKIMPEAQVLGPASAFWPVVGELLPIFPRFLK